MKIVAISGSPRRQGNCNTLIERFLAAAKKRGAATEFHRINDLKNIRGCQHCGGCRGTGDHCILKDDAAPILAAIQQADVVVYGTPIYFADASAQFKLVFDRHYSFFNNDFSPRLKPGKRGLVILSQGQAEEKWFEDVHERYESCLKFLGFAKVDGVRVCGANEPDTASKKPDLLARIDALAAEIAA